MTSIYKYTIPNLKYLNLLHEYIDSIPNLPSDFGLVSEDQVSIIFNQQLSDTQVNLLTTSINNYIPPQFYKEIYRNESLNITQSNINSTVYTSIATDVWIVDKNNVDIDLGNIVIVANLVGPQNGIITNNANYKLRLYNTMNNTILFESDNLINTDLQILTFSNIQNIPTIDSVLELQAKVCSNNYIVNILSTHYTFFKTFK